MMSRTSRAWTVAIVALAGTASGAAAHEDPFAQLPGKLTLTGIARDFRAWNVSGGHVDFEMDPPHGWGVYMGVVGDELDTDGKPVFKSTGYKVLSHWLDAKGRRIISPRSYIQPRPTDTGGSCEGVQGQVNHGQGPFDQWFRNLPGVNVANAYSIEMVRTPNTCKYIYDDVFDPDFAGGVGFFAVGNGNGGGNPQGGNQNFNFTYELSAEFPYIRGQGQYFTIGGANDVWAFVDGKLVIDNGGIHDKCMQTIELDRLAWLADAGAYKIRIFFAQRQKPESRYYIETDLMLRAVDIPETSGLLD